MGNISLPPIEDILPLINSLPDLWNFRYLARQFSSSFLVGFSDLRPYSRVVDRHGLRCRIDNAGRVPSHLVQQAIFCAAGFSR